MIMGIRESIVWRVGCGGGYAAGVCGGCILVKMGILRCLVCLLGFFAVWDALPWSDIYFFGRC